MVIEEVDPSSGRHEITLSNSSFNPFPFDESFHTEIVDKFEDGEEHFKEIVQSIDTVLDDWPERPNIGDVKKRYETVSKCNLFFHKDFDQVIGWGWFSTVFTYDWINESNPLPTDNSVYWGGTYIRKELGIPKTTGLQMYNHGFRKFLSLYETMYGYTDDWNKAPIKICDKLGSIPFKFIK